MPNWIVDDRLTTTLDGVLETHVHVEAGEVSITAGDCPSWIDVERRSGEAPIVTVEDGVLEGRYERPWRGWSRRGNRALVSMAVPAATVSGELLVDFEPRAGGEYELATASG